jgi:acyl carrier protein phosphodiesterase
VNYLAHFHLARADDGWIAGALLGDYIKGPLAADWPSPLRHGIQLHRRIDAFTDTHPLRLEFARHLPDNCRRYAGIVLDVCCDHWLSVHWARFEAQSLPDFSARIYAVLQANLMQMPAPAARMAQRLAEHDVLLQYRDAAVVAATLERIGWRLRNDNPLRAIGAELDAYLAAAEPIFSELYPQLLTQFE